MKQLIVLSKLMICFAFIVLLSSCMQKEENQTISTITSEVQFIENDEGINTNYTLAFRRSSVFEDLIWNDELSFDIIRVEDIQSNAVESLANENIKKAMTSWINGAIVNAEEVDLYIYCHSPRYLSFANTFMYGGRRIDYVNDYVTIDMKTGKRIQLSDLVQVNEDFVKYIQKKLVIGKSINPMRYGGEAKALWEYLNEFSVDELLEELNECSKTQEKVLESAHYGKDDIGALIFRNSFYLRDGELVIVINGDKHIPLLLNGIESFLKVEKW